MTKRLSEIRAQICVAMKEMDDEWVTTDSILAKLEADKVLTGRITKDKIGNNLRVLKNEGIVSDTKLDGKRCWSLTGKKYDVDPPVRMVVAFPKSVHQAMSEAAAQKGSSRTNYVINAVKTALETPETP